MKSKLSSSTFARKQVSIALKKHKKIFTSYASIPCLFGVLICCFMKSDRRLQISSVTGYTFLIWKTNKRRYHKFTSQTVPSNWHTRFGDIPGTNSLRLSFHSSPLKKNGLFATIASDFSSTCNRIKYYSIVEYWKTPENPAKLTVSPMALSWKYLKSFTWMRCTRSGSNISNWGSRPL